MEPRVSKLYLPNHFVYTVNIMLASLHLAKVKLRMGFRGGLKGFRGELPGSGVVVGFSCVLQGEGVADCTEFHRTLV